MVKATDQLIRLARAGASLELQAGEKSTEHLVEIAQALADGATLRLRGCDAKSSDNLERVARAAPGRVTLSFDD
jgi:hypothetical protein